MDGMLEETVTVVAAEAGWLWVEAAPKNACSGCSVAGCAGATLGRAFARRPQRLRVTDTLGARPGQRVVIGIPGYLLVRASFLAYLLPLLVTIGAGILAAALEWSQVGQALAVGAALFLGIYLAGRLRPAAGAVRLLRLAP